MDSHGMHSDSATVCVCRSGAAVLKRFSLVHAGDQDTYKFHYNNSLWHQITA